MADFAEKVLRMPLDAWQRWAAIHGLELLPDGRPRFRTLLILVARQGGKTHLVTVLTLFWLFVDRWPLVLGTSTNVRYAQEPWEKAVALATDKDLDLYLDMPPGQKGVRRVNGEQRLTTRSGCRYEIAASNARGGRSLSVDRLIQDELREHRTWDAWNAAVPATNARPNAQVVCISNQGDHRSVVLDVLHAGAMAYIETGEGDQRTGLFEWSSPPDRPLDDLDGLAQANPNVGRRNDWDTLLGEARRIMASGDLEAEAGFRTECRCEKVTTLRSALDITGWAAGNQPGTMDAFRDRLAAVFDISPDGTHASLLVAAQEGEAFRVEAVHAWDGADAVTRARRELPALVERVRPVVFGWFPGGPAASLAADLRERRRESWPPKGVRLEEIKQDTASACMGLATLVRAGEVLHSDDPLLNDQVQSVSPLQVGDRWVFSRRGSGTCDAVYAMAGAIHLARTAKPGVGKPRLISV